MFYLFKNFIGQLEALEANHQLEEVVVLVVYLIHVHQIQDYKINNSQMSKEIIPQ